MGSSGCGKSTLLRLVLGLNTDYDGDIRLDGQRVERPGLGPLDRFPGAQAFALAQCRGQCRRGATPKPVGRCRTERTRSRSSASRRPRPIRQSLSRPIVGWAQCARRCENGQQKVSKVRGHELAGKLSA
ncbi:ATP-binding cassette domain-containing protein [Mesorhizobium sp. M1005]|uniref:ATP-binding cassette domain-containing protein n=1 Tax=unclassified Mesorhizobium TaxID=325217 RepID=UPI003337FBF3